MALQKINEELNRKIVAKMTLENLTKTDLAEKLGLSYQTICLKLRGKIDWKYAEILNMATLFNVNLDYFNPKVSKSNNN